MSSQGVSVFQQGLRASLSSAEFEVLTQPQEDVNAEQQRCSEEEIVLRKK